MTSRSPPTEVALARRKRMDDATAQAAKNKADAAASVVARDANTARLKALRLEKERADEQVALAKPAAPPPAKRVRKPRTV